MPGYPRLLINLEKIRHNTEIISELAACSGIGVVGVTKACCGDPHVAGAMLAGGVVGIADSRIENIRRLKNSGIDADTMLLRTPMMTEVADVVENAEISLNSEICVVAKLEEEAMRREKKHGAILMVEMGDLREGIMPARLEETVEFTMKCEHIELLGLGMNLACFGGVVPTMEKIFSFDRLTRRFERKYRVEFEIVSGGNSAYIPFLLQYSEITKINNLRIGEGILLGVETVKREPISGTFQDAFILESEIIELKQKPSVPDGVVSQDAFGRRPYFEDRGIIRRGIVAIGRQDVIVEDLVPIDPRITILGASSDHIILHVENWEMEVGDLVRFSVAYGALVHLCTSGYVKKLYT